MPRRVTLQARTIDSKSAKNATGFDFRNRCPLAIVTILRMINLRQGEAKIPACSLGFFWAEFVKDFTSFIPTRPAEMHVDHIFP